MPAASASGDRLRGLELRALHGQRAARRRNRGDLGRGQLGSTLVRGGVAPGPAVVLALASIIATRGAVAGRAVAAVAGRAVGMLAARATVAGGPVTVLAPRAAIAIPIAGGPVTVLAARAAILARGRGRQGLGLGSLALGGRAPEGAARRGHDAGGLGAHAQDPAAAGGEDLEVEVGKTDPELVAGPLDGLFDRLAREFLVLAHD